MLCEQRKKGRRRAGASTATTLLCFLKADPEMKTRVPVIPDERFREGLVRDGEAGRGGGRSHARMCSRDTASARRGLWRESGVYVAPRHVFYDFMYSLPTCLSLSAQLGEAAPGPERSPSGTSQVLVVRSTTTLSPEGELQKQPQGPWGLAAAPGPTAQRSFLRSKLTCDDDAFCTLRQCSFLRVKDTLF